MHLSENPLSTKQRRFLESRKNLGINKSQYQKDILSHADKSVRYLHHILRYKYNLSEEDLYDIINAQTLQGIIERMLYDKEPNENGFYRYDFRTIEIARLLFNVIEDYFVKSPYFSENDAIHTDLSRVHHHFKTLAKFGLEKEQHEILDKEEERKAVDELVRITTDKNQQGKSLTTSEKNRINELQGILSKKHSHLKPYSCQIDPII